MLESLNGITNPVGTREQGRAETRGRQGSSFSSLLSDALARPESEAGPSSSAGASLSDDALSSGFNPLPSRGSWTENRFQAPKAPRSEGDQFNPLQWQRPWGSSGGGLPNAISTFNGDTFQDEIGLGQAQRVGGNIFQFHFAHMVEKDGVYYAYFIDHSGGTQNEIGLATSSDGVNFSYQGKVLERGESYDQLQASFPSVQYDEASKTWYMLYEGKSDSRDVNSVCLATSKDGRNWDKQGPVITPGQAGEMSAVDVGTPTFFKENGTWHVYFHGLAGDGRVRIGHASGTDLKNLKVDQGAMLDVDASGAQSGTVGARSNVVKVGDWYYMAYECSTAAKDFSQAQWGTSLARSRRPDGGWEKLDTGPIISNPKTGFGYDGPELSLQDDRLYLYYRLPGNGAARQEITGLG